MNLTTLTTANHSISLKGTAAFQNREAAVLLSLLRFTLSVFAIVATVATFLLTHAFSYLTTTFFPLWIYRPLAVGLPLR